MVQELNNAPDWLCNLFSRAWRDFENDKFSYDGATFVRERSNTTLFEVAAFIHDYLNAMGYVGFLVDYLFVEIMEILKYDNELIKERSKLLKYTIINIIRRKLMSAYKGDLNVAKWKEYNELEAI